MHNPTLLIQRRGDKAPSAQDCRSPESRVQDVKMAHAVEQWQNLAARADSGADFFDGLRQIV